jgi:polar amino acid transport system ATP-binding protein
MIEIKNIYKQFGSVHALNGVSLNIYPGKVMVIIGPSGSGKSTLLRCINHMEVEDKGEVWVDGDLLNGNQAHLNQIRSEMGMVFQLFNLYPHLTVLENITLAQRIVKKLSKQEALQNAMSQLTRVGIAEKANVYPQKLSGGQQQRVAIASVLAMEPEVIVLDEPTSFLDPLSAEKIFEVIYRLNKEQGITVILVEHRLDLTAKYANHLIVMDEGKVRFEGDPRQILSSEETRLMGVGIPKATLLYQMLKKKGLNLDDKTPLSSEELADQLLKELSPK